MTCNESLQSPFPSLTGFNIQASVMKIVTSERRESPELVSRKLEMAPNWMFQQLTDKTKKKTTNFQKFLSDDSNESLLSSSPSLTGINIQASVMKIVKVRKAPNENRPGPAPLRNVADLVYSNKLKQNRKNIHENITFTLATDEKSSRKIANPNMIR